MLDLNVQGSEGVKHFLPGDGFALNAVFPPDDPIYTKGYVSTFKKPKRRVRIVESFVRVCIVEGRKAFSLGVLTGRHQCRRVRTAPLRHLAKNGDS
ncbi:hypothetical protein K443DRAFT_238441 [Laccaria amethystina LaAM-08-1]|jgi:hypothetical protein|uniref:Uncharacterized protein n=1 Tax=Laccaria amethystina LaAM-08-1 TaxID=1095629 RepID=A0A0C9XJ81_9AGAR|nr:hypothetical protein K443DRAFT_238441 [Laccaria amethystina LaAM-08-1]